MTQQPPSARKEPRRGWLLLLLFAPGVWWMCSGEEEAAAPPAREEPTPIAVLELPPERPPAQPVVSDAAVEVPDSGAATVVDAGAPPRPNPTAPELEAYLKKWRDALEPIFKDRRPQPVKAIRAEGKTEPDAGVACERGTHPLALNESVVVDYLVVVDTSGSMRSEGLKAASEFIAYLEYFLARGGGEYRILVLAEPARLQLGGDAGVATRRIESHDGLDVMLASAVDEPPRWLAMLRTHSEVRAVLITDDRPEAREPKRFIDGLAQLFASRAYSFSVIGGFLAAKPLLMPDDAPSTSRCNSKSARGLDPGIVYQQVAIATKGFRSSLCEPTSRAALIEQLLWGSTARSLCAWNLGPKAHVSEARAVGKGRSEFLLREFNAAACIGMQRGYLLEGPMLSLCPDTCSTLKGFDALEVRVECDR